jgi:transcriptional regulator with GAF, ATPase, and Fis domain
MSKESEPTRTPEMAANDFLIVPHDFLMLGLLSEDRQRVRPIALSGGLPETSGDVVLAGQIRLAVESEEREMILQALARTGNNKSKAARILGLTRAQLRSRIERYGLTSEG